VLELPGGRGDSPHCGCGPPYNTRRRSLGAFGASLSSLTAFFLVRPLHRNADFWRNTCQNLWQSGCPGPFNDDVDGDDDSGVRECFEG